MTVWSRGMKGHSTGQRFNFPKPRLFIMILLLFIPLISALPDNILKRQKRGNVGSFGDTLYTEDQDDIRSIVDDLTRQDSWHIPLEPVEPEDSSDSDSHVSVDLDSRCSYGEYDPIDNCCWYEVDGFEVCMDSEDDYFDLMDEFNNGVDEMDDDMDIYDQLSMESRKGMNRQLGKKYTRWKIVVKMIAHIVAGEGVRKKDIIKKMLNYGCHCFPGQKRHREVGGKGPAMDQLDELCRTQYQCHKCVELEMQCDADKTYYRAKFQGGKRKMNLEKDIVCRDDSGTCSRNMCECDKKMATNLKDVWSIEIHNRQYWREKKNMRKGGVFDYEGICLQTGFSMPPNACCGSFPNVFPYNTDTKNCCVFPTGAQLFDPTTHICCADSIVTLTGTC